MIVCSRRVYYTNPMSRHIQTFRKLAQYLPTPTVGDVVNRVNADLTIPAWQKQDFVNSVNSAGLTVNQPGSRIPYVVGGAIAGHSLAKYLGARPFWDGVYTLGAALYGNHLYNKNNPKPMPAWADPLGTHAIR